MRFSFVALRRDDVPGILPAAVIVTVVLYLSLFATASFARHAKPVFEPDWNCQYVASGEPVCVKGVAKKTAN